MTRPRNSLLVELPLLGWLVLVWGALWGDFGLGNLLVGLVLALLVTWFLYLPPVQLSGRFNPFQFAVFAVTFVWQVAKASVEVMVIAIVVGPRARNAVVGVRLRTTSDLLLTATGHTMTLIPGSLVVEVDRATSTLYFHALNVRNPQEAEEFRRSALQVEAAWIRIMGTSEELAALRAERRGEGAAGADRRDSAVIGSPVTASQQIVGRRRDDVPAGAPADAPSDDLTILPADGPGTAPGDLPADLPVDRPADEPSTGPGDDPNSVPGDVPADDPEEDRP